jgi:hypothetical protein
MATETIVTTAAPFVVQPQLTAIAIAYQNARMIADSVLPRVPVNRADFKYTVYDKRDTFTIPDTKVGRTSRPNEVDWHATEAVASVRPWGLEEPIPQEDFDNAAGTPIDPEAQATEQLTDLILLDREQRAANLVFNAASYAANNKTTLTAAPGSQWSDPTSEPATVITDAMDSMIVRPNTMVLGRRTATWLRRNPNIIKAYNQTLGDQGKVPLAFLQDLFEVDNILVGEAWANTAKKGQVGSFARVWGDHAALLYINPVSQNVKSMTFGVTAQWGERIAGTRPDPDCGLKGGVRVRVGEEVKELVLANDLGYFFQNAVAN